MSTFYVTGGTLPLDAPCYVERQADRDLYQGLVLSEFCYVLTARQMGKSSIMIRAAKRLRQRNIQVVVLDLTAIGQNVTPEQWYNGLIARLGRQVDLEDKLEHFWVEKQRVSPIQRFISAIHDVVLAERTEPLVIFVDEIDAVRSLPFSTDEFFAAIRECYNRRVEDPEFKRVAFCLLGVASPADLIRDPRITPFHIGHRIELTDFTKSQSAAMTEGLRCSNADAVLDRVLYWTNGHPYLTQRHCQMIASDIRDGTVHDVDRVCSEIFLSSRARERDDNLLFVRERLLRSEVDLGALLKLYDQIREGHVVRDDETNPLHDALRLSGITRVRDGFHHVRNRIYEHVFDHHWVKANSPGTTFDEPHSLAGKCMLSTSWKGVCASPDANCASRSN
ncbi:MAG: hypothetical protein FJ403_16425 [Verrucomicrobia bacterium]|nr:hypothetical protein [Verrucomicrobiota bacterium]